MIYWNTTALILLPLLGRISDDKVYAKISAGADETADDWNFGKSQSLTQGVERCVKLVTEASKNSRHRQEPRSNQESRALMPNFPNKYIFKLPTQK